MYMRKEEWYSAIQDFLENKKVFEDKHEMGKKEEDKNADLKSFFASHFGLTTKNIIIKKNSHNKKESE